jgi:DNA replication protein DnaC
MAATASSIFQTLKTEQRHCEKHGEYRSDMCVFAGRELWKACPSCDDEKRKQDEIDSQRAFLDEQEQRRINLNLRDAMIPVRFSGATFENYICKSESQRKIFNGVQDYANSFPGNRKNGTSVIMTGGVGTGKTHLAIAAAHSVIYEHKLTARYVSLDRVLIAIKSSFGKGSELSQQGIYEKLSRPDLLIIDEVGAQHATEFEKLVMFDIINSRYEDIKPTMLISNLGIKQVVECVGERAIDRLRENGGKSFVFDWNSARR